jgi:hypothetical protein
MLCLNLRTKSKNMGVISNFFIVNLFVSLLFLFNYMFAKLSIYWQRIYKPPVPIAEP